MKELRYSYVEILHPQPTRGQDDMQPLGKVWEEARLTVVGAAEDLDGVRKEMSDHVERFDRALGTSWEIDDDGFVADGRDAAG